MELAVARADRVEVRGVELGRGHLAALDEPERVLRGEPQRVDRGAHAVGGTRNRSRSAAGALRRTSSSGSESCGSSSAQTLTRSSGCDVGGTSGEVELRHLRDGVEDRAELARQPLDLGLGEVEPRQPRHVQHLLTVDRHLDPSFQRSFQRDDGRQNGPPCVGA